MVIGDYLPYRFLWSSDEEWLQAVMNAERYDLLKRKDDDDEIQQKEISHISSQTQI
jgi:hypothetical protein